MNEEKMNEITTIIKEKVWRNPDVMFPDIMEEDDIEMLTDIISSLHNLLYEQVTGHKYNYAFHWCNKIGADTNDNIFDEIGEKYYEKI